MTIDIPTLMLTGATVAMFCGVVLMTAWFRNRYSPVLASWGLAKLALAGGMILLLVGLLAKCPFYTASSGVILALSHSLAWNGTRLFENKTSAPLRTLAGPALLAIVNLYPETLQLTATLRLLVNATYIYLTAYELWAHRKAILPSRYPLIILLFIQATILLIGSYTLSSWAWDQSPPAFSFFSLIHFSTLLFAVATTVLIIALIKERSEASSKLSASIDSLTGVANRGAFIESAEKALMRCRHDDVPASVLMFDLDNFKSVNDTYGHAVGDAVIKRFCEIAATFLRPHDILGRFGGEEFAVVLPDCGIDTAYMRANQLRNAFAEGCLSVNAYRVHATVSAGVSAWSQAHPSISTSLEEADAALYCAKAEGRNNVRRAPQRVPRKASISLVHVA